MRILDKQILTEAADTRIVRLKIDAAELSLKARPGQFVVLMLSEYGERIPLTIVDTDNNAITVIFQEAGLTTKMLAGLAREDELYALVGPLGKPTEIANFGKVILVGGGVGSAEIYPVARALKAAGNNVTVVLGARNKSLLILEQDFRMISDQVFIATDDGSYGEKAFTTDILERLLGESKYDLVYAVGPLAMMEKAAVVTKKYNVKTIVSLNALMVDATGMCGCCRVTVSGETKFSCVDGPEFNAHLVDWQELLKRNKAYVCQEKHICRLKLNG